MLNLSIPMLRITSFYIFLSLEPIFRLRNQSTLQMLQSYDHSGEEMSRKRVMDQDDENGNAGNKSEGKGAKILRQEKDHTNDEGKEKNGNEDDNDNVDPPARERPAVSGLHNNCIIDH